MTALSTLAPGKVNLCLFVGAPRGDGLHPLATTILPTTLADEVTMRPAQRDEAVCEGVSGPNLALEALRLWREIAPLDPQRVEIVKRVPVAGGMGGGSADAAAVLRLAAHASGADPALARPIAARLGHDVGPALRASPATVAPDDSISWEHVPPRIGLLVLPSAQRLSTAAVYAEFDRADSPRSPAELDALAGRLSEALRDPGLLINDLEPAARRLCPSIDEALATARDAGADHVMVSGSGPTVVGLFLGEGGPERAQTAAKSLAGRDPAPVAARPIDPGAGSVTMTPA